MNNNHCCFMRWVVVPQYPTSTLSMASSMKKCTFFPQETSAVSKQLAQRSPQMQVRQQKKERKEESQQCAVTGMWTGLQPAPHPVSQWDWIRAHASQERATNPRFPLPHFHLAVWGHWSCGTNTVLMVRKSCLVSLPVLHCALLLLMHPSGTFSFGFPLPAARPQTCLH